MVRNYTHRPPVDYITNDEMHEVRFHRYQCFDLLNGSGDVSVGPHSEQLMVDQVTGSGPIYNIDLIYSGAHPDSGIKLIQIGDKLLMAETDDPKPEPFEPCWYVYYIRDHLNDMGAESGRFEVEYMYDSCFGYGDQAPDQLCYDDTGTGGYGGTCNDSRVSVFREVNMPFTVIPF